MPWVSVRLKPGLDVEETPTYDSAAYNETNYGRFKAGLFQKLGGWTKYYPFALNGDGKELHAWQDLNSNKYLGVGTTVGLSVINSGNIKDVSPQYLETSDPPNYSTVISTSTVEIVDTNITNVTPDDSVFFRTPVSVGGLILSGLYQIATRTGANSYTIEARANATATVNNGGAVPIFDSTLGSSRIDVTLPNHGQVEGSIVVFQIPTTVGGVVVSGKYGVTAVVGVNEFSISTNSVASSTATVPMNGGESALTYYIALGPGGAGGGYGLGGYGLGFYGIGDGGGGAAQAGDALPADDWSLDNWGEILMSNPEDGGIYYWNPTSGYQNSSIVSSAPFFNSGMFVSMAQQQVITYGSSINAYEEGGIGVYQDPLLVQWSDSGDFFTWAPTADNQAGNFRIPTGSEIVGGLATQNRNLIWTDLDLWGMGYTNSEFVYAFNKIGSNCGLIGKHARAQFGNAVYWMSRSNFFFYAGGGVQPIPCSVYDDVFQDLDLDNAHKCVAGSNTDFTEVWFFYPSLTGGTGKPDKYAKINLMENTWDVGTIDRCSWIDRSILGSPIAIGSSNNIIYSHESGYNADDTPLLPSFTTGYFYLDEGESFTFIDQIYPDFKFGTVSGQRDAQILITINAVETPGQTPITYGPFLVTKDTMYVNCRIRARQISMTVWSEDQDSFWRLGLVRFRFSTAGRR